MEPDGDVDAVVLRVRENAALDRLLMVNRLEVGEMAKPPEGRGGSPNAGSTLPSGGTAPGAPRLVPGASARSAPGLPGAPRGGLLDGAQTLAAIERLETQMIGATR